MGEAKRRSNAIANDSSPLDRRLLEAARIMGLIDIRYADQRGPGGTCMMRGLIGSYVLGELGIRADQHFGGLLYRVGPDPERDVLRLCASNNVGIYTTDGPCAFHSWLYANGYIIDFSVGSWPAMTKRIKDRPCADGLQWTIDQPPSYWVKCASKVRDEWKPQGVPDIGEVWYGPICTPEGEYTIHRVLYRQFEHLKDAVPLVVKKVRRDGTPFTLMFDEKARETYAPNQVNWRDLLR
jgi:hypothetical protein